MLSATNTSKEIIKNRMLKHALNYWNIKNTEDLDPAVKLIMESLSLELYNLENEITDTHVRILEKVANLLTPDSLTSPNTAHAIMHASPVEAIEQLRKTTSFIAQKKVSSKQNEELDTTLDIYFTPVDNIHLLDVQVACIVTGGMFYKYGATFDRQLFAKSQQKIIENHSIWVGLRVNRSLENIKHLILYFDWRNLETRLMSNILQLLPLSKWYIDNEEISISPGIQYIESAKADSYENIFLDYDLISLKEKDIKNIYDQRFITITDTRTTLLSKVKLYPASFEGLFTPSDLQKFTEKLLWLKIEFPPAMHREYLHELHIYPNAFPVVNRKLIDLKYRLKGGTNIIPLRTEIPDQFLSVRSLSDETHDYRSVPFRKNEEEEVGNYTLRTGGVERFDNRNARELINYLLELLRSESAAFSAYGYDFIATTLKELNQKIFLMEQKTRGYINQSTEIPTYIIAKPYEGRDLMYVQYWTTMADVANNLRAGTRLEQAKGVKVKQDSMFLVTTSIGGKNRLKPEEKLNAFRYGLVTRSRIITTEDIRSFCYYEFGERISKVEIKKGFEMAVNSKQGFRRTIDVVITPSNMADLENSNWEILSEQIRVKLQARSGVMNNYRIIVETIEQ